MESLGQILRHERNRRALFQREVGGAADIGQERLSRYESGRALPSWPTFVRVLAAMGAQPRVVVEPLDIDVDEAIGELQRRPAAEWLADVSVPLRSVRRLLAGLSWAATGLFAARLHGAPVPLTRLDVDAVMPTQAWELRTRNAMGAGVPLMEGFGTDYATVPTSPTHLRCTADSGTGRLEWLLPEGTRLLIRIVTLLSPRCVVIQHTETPWPSVPLDLVASDDPWTSRVLARLREREREQP